MQIPFYTTDVFTNQTFGGAQIAVIPDADHLTGKQMQHIAGEFNLPTTVFICSHASGSNRYSLRLFTPQKEIEFGSHTTVAAAHVLASIGKIELREEHTPVTFDHNHGSLSVHVTHRDGKPTFTQLSLSTKPVVDNYVPTQDELGELLGLDPQAIGIKNFKILLVANNGVYVVVPIRRFDTLCAATFNRKVWNESSIPGSSAQHILLFSQQTETQGSDFHLRLLGPQVDVNDDPPVGSAMPAFAAYLCSHAHISKGTYSFIAERGLKSKRQSLLNVEIDNKPAAELTLRVGGSAVMVCEGKITL